MNTKLISAAAVAATIVLLPLQGQAAVVAHDSASDPVYSSGYATGQNGGTGFAPFVVTTSATGSAGAGTFVFTAAESEGGTGIPPTGSIDTPNPTAGQSPLSFGMYSQGNGGTTGSTSVTVSRNFSVPLTTGESFSLDWVKGYNDGGSAGVELSTATDTTGVLLYNGGNGVLSFNGTDTTNGFKAGADHLVYTLTSPTAYTFTLSGADTYSGSGTTTGPITNFEVFQTNSGATSPDHNAYFNSPTVTSAVPEASSSVGLGVLLALGGLALFARKRSVKA